MIDLPITASEIRALPPDEQEAFMHNLQGSMSDEEAFHLKYMWEFWARDKQLPPPYEGNWVHWLILAGRGFGKTRTGAEWVRDLVQTGRAKYIACVAPTAADVRNTMVEGESGLLAVFPPDERPAYEPSKRRVTFKNGAIATLFSADEPERFRGPQHDAAWLDELCAWRYPDFAFDMLMFGLRLGEKPRTCITTTPKPTKLIKRLVGDKDTFVTRGTTYDNLENLASTFKKAVVDRYEGTRLGRQELNAEILDDVAGALWSRSAIDNLRLTKQEYEKYVELVRIGVAIDPPATSGASADECGIVVVGMDDDGMGYVLADETTQGMSPNEWAKHTCDMVNKYNADYIIAEVNQGGDMIKTIIKGINSNVIIKEVRATKGKATRAEPISALYEQGKVRHIGTHGKLEDQMCVFTMDFDKKSMGFSPDRVDALVWGLTDIMQINKKSQIRIRSL